MMDSDTSDAAEPLEIATEDAAEEAEAWLPYEQFAAERSRRHEASMLGHGSEHFVFEFPEPPDFFPPPPPIPGSREECATFSSHFDNCDISKESTSPTPRDPYLHLMSVIVAVFCLIILASCITIFLVWRRRRSKAHAGDLHSYCVSRGGGGGGGQFYDDLYISGQLGAGHATRGRGSNQYSAHHNTFYNRNQVDLASFLLQSSPSSGQPIYEEIPGQPLLGPGGRGSSDHSSDYVDTTSGYHTLPLDNEYCESEAGLFLVPVSSVNKPLIMTKKDFQVPGGKTNKKFFTFHRKTLESTKAASTEQEVVNSNFLNTFEAVDNKQQLQPKRTKCGKTFVHSKTLDISNQNYGTKLQPRQSSNRAIYRAPYQPSTTLASGAAGRAQLQRHGAALAAIQRQNQDNFLPRTAWTDTSGSDDWLDAANDNTVPGPGTTHSHAPAPAPRPSCPSPPDLISGKCRGRGSPASPSTLTSTSDVTVSPSSSESYPECRF